MGTSRSSRGSGYSYAALEPRVHHVPEAAVRKKWKKLAPGPQDNIKQLLLALKSQAMAQMASKPKDAALGAAVEEVTKRLMQRLPRMPFPPRTEESHFDFEATLDRMRLLENQLTSNVNSMNLLRAQIRKEEKALRLDREELEALEDGAKSSEVIRRKQTKTLHPLARSLNTDAEAAGNIKSADSHSKAFSVSELETDEQVQPLVKQLHDHLESMENNMTSTREIETALQDAQVALDVFTASNLDPKQYAQLYGLEVT